MSDVESAKLYSLPQTRVSFGIAVSVKRSCTLAGEKADLMIATEPKAELGDMFEAAGGAGKPRVCQIALCYGVDRDAAVQRAATEFVTPEQVAEQLACGPDVDEHVAKIKPFIDAGFDEVALVHVGGDHQEAFIRWAEKELLPAPRDIS